MVDLTEPMSLNPSGNLNTVGTVSAGGNVIGHIVQARNYAQSLGDIHVSARARLYEWARVSGHLGIYYIHGWWWSFYADWDWGGPGNLYSRVNNIPGLDAWLGAPSDERLKQDIQPSSFDCLANVLQWPLYQFRWKDSDKPTVPIGFVAQRQAEVFPESVAKGKPEDGSWSINTNVALAALTGAVQQLLARVEALEAHGA